MNPKNFKYMCKTHPNDRITNYCCMRSCQRPLCPECIDDHNKTHAEKNQYPKLGTISKVKKMCIEKLKMLTESLQQNLEKLEEAKYQYSEETLQKSLEDLDTLRLKLIDKVNYYFLQLKKNLKMKFNEKADEILKDFKQQDIKIKNVMEELKNIDTNLYGINMFEAFKNVSNLDSNQLLEYFHVTVGKSYERSMTDTIQCLFSNNDYLGFMDNLQNIVSLEATNIEDFDSKLSFQREGDHKFEQDRIDT